MPQFSAPPQQRVGGPGSEQQVVAVPLEAQLKIDLEGKNGTLSEDGKSAAPNPSLPTRGRPPARTNSPARTRPSATWEVKKQPKTNSGSTTEYGGPATSGAGLSQGVSENGDRSRALPGHTATETTPASNQRSPVVKDTNTATPCLNPDPD